MLDIPADEYLTKGASRTRSAHSKKYRQYRTSTDSLKYSFSPAPYLCGILFQHPLLRPILWYPSRRGRLHFPSKMLRAHLPSNSSRQGCRGRRPWYRHGRQIGLCLMIQKQVGKLSSFYLFTRTAFILIAIFTLLLYYHGYIHYLFTFLLPAYLLFFHLCSATNRSQPVE